MPGPVGLDLLDLVAETGILLAGERELLPFLERSLGAARRLARAEAGTLFVREDDHLRFAVVHNDPLIAHLGEEAMRRLFEDRILPLDESSVAGYVAATREIVNVADAYAVAAAPRFDQELDVHTGYKTCSILAVPLVSRGGDTAGVLQLINALDGGGAIVPFDERLELPVCWLAAQATAAIERDRELQEPAFVDEVTGMPNREYLLRCAEEHVMRHRRFGHPVSVVFVAIDHLADVAAREGPTVASAIVQGLARHLVRTARPFTMIGRYGEDTFGAVLANTGKAGALGYARRVKRLADGASQGGDALTTSVSLASVPEDVTTAYDLIETALERLGAARHRGGDAIRAE